MGHSSGVTTAGIADSPFTTTTLTGGLDGLTFLHRQPCNFPLVPFLVRVFSSLDGLIPVRITPCQSEAGPSVGSVRTPSFLQHRDSHLSGVICQRCHYVPSSLIDALSRVGEVYKRLAQVVRRLWIISPNSVFRLQVWSRHGLDFHMYRPHCRPLLDACVSIPGIHL